MQKILITGQNGFIGRHLFNYLKFCKQEFHLLTFERKFFHNDSQLDSILLQADTIIHLAGLNRHDNEQVIYETNMALTEKIIQSLHRTKHKPHVVFSDSTQIDTIYSQSKKQSSKLFKKWAKQNEARYTVVKIPNIFGPFSKPFYNTVVATLCYQLINNQQPKITKEASVDLFYINDLLEMIYSIIMNPLAENIATITITETKNIQVATLNAILTNYKDYYINSGIIPELNSKFEINLFNTFRSFINHEKLFPFFLKENNDDRGNFVEIVKTKMGGQFSFSSTNPRVTRGEHFHLRKIERFIVIKGKALIQMRKIDEQADKVLNFYVDGDNPCFVDMPVWYTHNIQNIGEEELYTLFYVNEFFDEKDSDTYPQQVHVK